MLRLIFGVHARGREHLAGLEHRQIVVATVDGNGAEGEVQIGEYTVNLRNVKMPVLNVDDYVFGYANITYNTTIVRSTDFNAAIPATLAATLVLPTPPLTATTTKFESISAPSGFEFVSTSSDIRKAPRCADY